MIERKMNIIGCFLISILNNLCSFQITQGNCFTELRVVTLASSLLLGMIQFYILIFTNKADYKNATKKDRFCMKFKKLLGCEYDDAINGALLESHKRDMEGGRRKEEGGTDTTIGEECNGQPSHKVHFLRKLRALSLVSATLEFEYATQFRPSMGASR